VTPRPHRRHFGVAAFLAIALCLGGTAVVATNPSAEAATTIAPVLGLLSATPANFASERAAGINSVTIGAAWSLAERSPGVFSASYMATVQSQIAAAHAAGLQVVFDTGLQYPPAWVDSLPGGTQFVNQYGHTYSGPGASGNNVVNAITDQSVRSAEGTYLAWLGTQITPGQITAVREGGGPLGELRYPSATYNSDQNSFWGYDASTQAALPASVQGWVPGTGTAAQAATFLNAYNQAIDNYGIWLNGQLHAAFNVRELVLLPGWGQRPGSAAAEETALLAPVRPPGNSNKYNEFNEGLDWTDLLGLLPDAAHSVAYTTYLDAQTVAPGGIGLIDPADYLATLVQGTPILLGGENTGNGSLTTMTFCMSQALRLNFYMVNWNGEPQLLSTAAGTDPTGPTLAQVGDAFSSVPAMLSSTPPTFPATVIGQTVTELLTVTAYGPSIINQVTASGPFSVGAPSAPLPDKVAAGRTLVVPVTFSPQASGPLTGAVTVTTAGARQEVVPLTAVGEQSGPSLAATSTTAAFAGAPPGGSSTTTVTFFNNGSAPVTVSSTTLPSAPFTAVGAPVAGSVIQPGGRVTVTLTFSPTTTGSFSDALVVASDGGTQSVALTATGTPSSQLVLTPLSLAFGSVRLGQSSSQSFQLNNVGGSTLTITSSVPPTPGSFSGSALPVGTTIPAGGTLVESVSFAPTDVGATSGQWTIGANDGQGAHTVSFTGTGYLGDPSVTPWTDNGATFQTPTELHVTPATTANVAGSAFWPHPISSAHLVATFTSFIGSGTGGEGTALILANASAPATSLGTAGVGLGFDGIPGIAVALDTDNSPGNPSSNFVGITDGPLSGAPTEELHWLATNSSVVPLTGPRTITVSLENGLLTVAIGGTQVLSQNVTVGPKVLLGFSGSTGSLTDLHSVANVSVVAG
jgi:hypothetical protein